MREEKELARVKNKSARENMKREIEQKWKEKSDSSVEGQKRERR